MVPNFRTIHLVAEKNNFLLWQESPYVCGIPSSTEKHPIYTSHWYVKLIYKPDTTKQVNRLNWFIFSPFACFKKIGGRTSTIEGNLFNANLQFFV